MLNLACRHHVAEIVLQAVFGLEDISRSCDIEMFARFRDYWPKINQALFSTALDDETVASLVSWKDVVVEFATQ